MPPVISDLTATWEIGNKSTHAGTSVSVPITITAEDLEALKLNSFKFDIDFQFGEEGPKYTGFTLGTSYKLMNITEGTENQFAGTLAGAADEEQAANNSILVYLNFDVPEGTAADVYKITFKEPGVNDTVEAIKVNDNKVAVTEVDGYIEVLAEDVVPTVVQYQYNIQGKKKFYFSHDNRPFDLKNDLIEVGTLKRREIYSDNTAENPHVSDWSTVNELVDFELVNKDLNNPKAVFENEFPEMVPDKYRDYIVANANSNKHDAYFKSTLKFVPVNADYANMENAPDWKFVNVDENGNVTEELADDAAAVTGTVYIGVKGDTTLNGVVNSKDAASVLVYAANFGAGNEAKILAEDITEEELKLSELEEAVNAKIVLEDFVYFLSDVNGESEDHGATSNGAVDAISETVNSPLRANDAGFMLVYAANQGAGNDPNWYDTLTSPLPKYTKEIGEFNGMTGKE